ncbi:YtxH domain-containing protein [Maridesulfovibrio zosterae]|uniref:YtxH domain-containing protein n=1 Tax=Maridesulfovibrio zosterae TaxID=82171 RepID=UPI0004145587|nr:YtxH domain-containing protein [Maridesulfovibrio zosterae]
MSWIKKLVYVLCLVAFLSVSAGCEDQGTGEKLGKKFDEAVDQAKDKMDGMSDKAKETYEDMKDKAKEVMDK